MARMDAKRFRKVCGLLGSDQAGERAAAALKATAMLKDAGMTWEDVGLLQMSPLARHRFGTVGNGPYGEAEMLRAMLELERARSKGLADDLKRSKREVDRLKGIWPKGKPPR